MNNIMITEKGKLSPRFVFIHCAGLGGWIFNSVEKELDVTSLSIDLPKRDEEKEARANLSLADYTSRVVRQIHEAGLDNIILVAHSIGGVIALQVAEELEGKIASFVGISAAIPKSNQSFVSSLPFPKNILMPVIMRLAGTRPPDSVVKRGLCNDLINEQVDQVVARYKPEALRLYTDKMTATAPKVPSLYIRTLQDDEFDIRLQTSAAERLHQSRVEDIDTGHLPMLSKPEELADILKQYLKTLCITMQAESLTAPRR